MIVSLMVNENPVSVEVESNTTLLQVLREQLGLTGSKFGCGTNDCGACKVLVNEDAKNSCVLLAKNMVGKPIYTIEFFLVGIRYTLYKKAFLEAGAIQCGYCTPGMVITTIAIIK
ncbi:(2Fe-2S)-binding protein [endosymbiont 'TC1' of Trimyema compressum]|uniref:(2Fe-2S)-binding protein n=1 Tax=endosymbiont 'TC1' of Trimyema compressum TaxID=243899 RepID=UPI000A3EFE5E|nr:2Fe-2S iron-sulfur cluster-binding protein [endosymbiont 'TC1' of Trimyema compressum]